MSQSRDQIARNALMQIEGLKWRPELANEVPYPLAGYEPLLGQALTLQAASPRMRAAVRAETSRIQDIAYELRGMLNANVSYAASVLGHSAPELKDFAGVPHPSGRRAERATTVPNPGGTSATV